MEASGVVRVLTDRTAVRLRVLEDDDHDDDPHLARTIAELLMEHAEFSNIVVLNKGDLVCVIF